MVLACMIASCRLSTELLCSASLAALSFSSMGAVILLSDVRGWGSLGHALFSRCGPNCKYICHFSWPCFL